MTSTNDAKELAGRVLAFLDLQHEVSKARDSSGGLSRVRVAESELRRLCDEIAGGGPKSPTLFDAGDR